MQQSRLIINADDFGYNKAINAAIVSCFKKNIINSTTIMANMEGFDEAVQLACQNNFEDKVGLHVNLTEGRPLTDMSGTGLVDQNGRFVMGTISKPFILLPPLTRRKIKIEIREQYNKLIGKGILPTHIDSHQHVHNLSLLAPIFISFAKEKNQKLRVAWVFKRKNFIKSGRLLLLNAYLKKRKLNFTDKFTNVRYLTNYLRKSKNINPIFEIMIHPAYMDNNLIDISEKTDIEKEIKQLRELYFRENFEK